MKKKADTGEIFSTHTDHYSFETQGNRITALGLHDFGWDWDVDEEGIYLFLARISGAGGGVFQQFSGELKSEKDVSAIFDAAVRRHADDDEALDSLGWYLLGDNMKLHFGDLTDDIANELENELDDIDGVARALGIPVDRVTEEMHEEARAIFGDFIRLPKDWINENTLVIVQELKDEIDFTGWESFMESIRKLKRDSTLWEVVNELRDKGIYDGTLFDFDGFREEIYNFEHNLLEEE